VLLSRAILCKIGNFVDHPWLQVSKTKRDFIPRKEQKHGFTQRSVRMLKPILLCALTLNVALKTTLRIETVVDCEIYDNSDKYI
jgi:hypothetical protein